MGKVRRHMEVHYEEGGTLLTWLPFGCLENMGALKKSTPKKPTDQTVRK